MGEESPRGTRCGLSLVDFRRTSRREPEFLRNRQGVQLPHCMGSRGRVSEGHASGHTASWWPSLAGNLSSQLAFLVSLSSAQSCLWRVSGAARRGHGACTAKWRFQHCPAHSLLIFLMQTLSPLLMNLSRSVLVVISTSWPFAGVYVCVCVCTRACAQNQRGPLVCWPTLSFVRGSGQRLEAQLVSGLCSDWVSLSGHTGLHRPLTVSARQKRGESRRDTSAYSLHLFGSRCFPCVYSKQNWNWSSWSLRGPGAVL